MATDSSLFDLLLFSAHKMRPQVKSSSLSTGPVPPPSAVEKLQRRGNSKYLAVMLHGFVGAASDMYAAANVLHGTPEGAHTDTLIPNLPLHRSSQVSPLQVLADLVATIDAAWAEKERNGAPYESVVLIGHSMGSLFIRKLYVVAMGERSTAPLEPGLRRRLAEPGTCNVVAARPWGPATTRIVLLAGMNQGWTISHHMSLTRAIGMTVGLQLGRLVQALGGDPFIIMAAQRGSPFVAELRLQWLALHSSEKAAGRKLAHVVQLLGTKDDLVPPRDNVDAVTGADFSYLEVPFSGHADVVEMDETPAGAARRRVFELALTLSPDAQGWMPSSVLRFAEPDPSVRHVLFVIHGIRDEGFWTEKIGARVTRYALEMTGTQVALETSSYGYFPMLSFLRPGARQEKVEWLVDKYTEAKARYPNAEEFSFVGHSHGTYLLLRALEGYPGVRFRRVVLAGSVLRSDHNWRPYLEGGRVEQVLNFVASADWVVAFFPNAMQKMNWQDLGGAGHDGFRRATTGLVQLPPNSYANGGHSAALSEEWWDAIARFVVDGSFSPPDTALKTSQSTWVRWGALLSPAIWALLAAIAALVLWVILQSSLREWHKTVAVGAYLWVLWLALTRL